MGYGALAREFQQVGRIMTETLRRLAQQTSALLPWGVLQDRRRLSEWIDTQKAAAVHCTQTTSHQAAFAERIA